MCNSHHNFRTCFNPFLLNDDVCLYALLHVIPTGLVTNGKLQKCLRALPSQGQDTKTTQARAVGDSFSLAKIIL